MADYVVRLTGKDELSGTLNKVKQELNQTGDAGSRLDLIRDRFNKITTSSAPLKRKLREIQGIMALMNLDGLDKSDVFAEMAALAGAYKDAIGDAALATRLLSSDTSSLDAMIGGLSAISSAASIATGVMGLFGVENDKVLQAILRVQSALSILSGVLELSNLLNKDGILRLKGVLIWELIKAAATTTDTGATNRNTGAVGRNTLALIASKLALLAWNVVKAVGKALLGDWTGLVLVGATALTTYALCTNKNTEELEKLNDSTKKVSDTFGNTYALNLSQTMSKYELLRNEYINLKSEHLRIEWIRNNQSEFLNLGLSVTDVSSAENVFVNNTNRVVQALDLRALAAAWAAIAQEKYEAAFKARLLHKQLNEDVTNRRRNLNNQHARAAGNNTYHDRRRYKSTGKLALQLLQIEDDNLRLALDATREAVKSKSKELSYLGKMGGKPNSGGGRRNTPISKKDTTTSKVDTKKEVIPEGSIKLYNEKISELKTKIELSVDPNERAKLLEEIDGYKLKIDNINFEINKIRFNDAVIAKGINDNTLKDTKKAFSKQLSNIKIPPIKIPPIKLPPPPPISDEFDKLKDTLSNLGGTFGDITSKWIDLAKLFETGASASDIAGNSLVILGLTLLAIGGNGTAAKVGAVMAAIGLIILGFAAAATSPAVTSTGWGWLAFVGAGLAAVATTISTLQSFSTGGIIQGGLIAGDLMLARVNAGEMILNGSQLKNLFNLLDSGGALAGSGNGNVEFRISGSSLKGVLRNYDSKMNKIR